MHYPLSTIWKYIFIQRHRTVAKSQQRESLCFCFLLSCAHVLCDFFSRSWSRSVYSFLSVLYLNKLPVNVPRWRIGACALAETDTILLWPNGKDLQLIITPALSDVKIKANPNKKWILFHSEPVDGETARGEQLARLRHQIHYHWSQSPALLFSWLTVASHH